MVLCLDPAVYLSLEDVEKFGVNEVLYKPFVQVEFFNILRKAAGVPIQDNDTFKGQVFSETPLLSYDLKKKKILVVDDDEFLRRATALRVSSLSLFFLLHSTRRKKLTPAPCSWSNLELSRTLLLGEATPLPW